MLLGGLDESTQGQQLLPFGGAGQIAEIAESGTENRIDRLMMDNHPAVSGAGGRGR